MTENLVLAWTPGQVGIKGNEKIDGLAKKKNCNMEISNIKIVYIDFKKKINNFIKSKWQTIWDTFPKNKHLRILKCQRGKHKTTKSVKRGHCAN